MREERLETRDVERALIPQLERIATSAPANRACDREQLAQLGDVDLQQGSRRRRRRLAPDGVNEPRVAAAGGSRDRERGQQAPLLER
jgi:hypothetical protein